MATPPQGSFGYLCKAQTETCRGVFLLLQVDVLVAKTASRANGNILAPKQKHTPPLVNFRQRRYIGFDVLIGTNLM
jgi:hypothetical protein